MKFADQLDAVLSPTGLQPVFQPIYQVHGNLKWVHAVECLMRGPAGTHFEMPSVLFEWVRECGQEVRADRACASVCLKAAAQLPGPVQLNVNVHTATLCRDAQYAEFLTSLCADLGIATNRITVEIIENSVAGNRENVTGTLRALRKQGVRVAVDDLGVKQANVGNILEIRPDFLKIDDYVTQGCHRDYYRRVIIESLVTLGRRLGALVIAECVEDFRDLHTLTSLGIDLVQGFVHAKPMIVIELVSLLLDETAIPRPGALLASVKGSREVRL